MCQLHYMKCLSFQTEEWRSQEFLICFFIIWVIHVAQLWLLFSRIWMNFSLFWPVSNCSVCLEELREGVGWWQVWKDKACFKREMHFMAGLYFHKWFHFFCKACVRPGLRFEVLWLGPERRLRAGGGLFLVRWTSKKFSLSIQSSPSNRLNKITYTKN